MRNLFKKTGYTVSLFLFILAIQTSCKQRENSQNKNISDKQEVTQFVNPLIGTYGDGNTYPGAVVPFGFVQLSPDTELKDWGAASGYEYSDSTLYGFSMTHFNGTGIPDLGDFLFVPSVGKLQFNQGEKSDISSGYITSLNHKRESAKPGYYSLFLDEHNINVELSASERAGILKFTFPQTDSANVMIDLAHVLQWKTVWSNVRIENNHLITGYHQIKGWAKDRQLYFAAQFSKPFDSCGIISEGKLMVYNTYRFRSKYETAGKDLKVFARYKTTQKESIVVKVGISAVSSQNALENLNTEIGNTDFDSVVKTASNKWNKELNKMTIEGSVEDKETFYTSLYHAFLTPTIYEDCNGEYRGFDKNIHKSENFTNYTVFSLWDTYRATHPLFNLLQASRNEDMVKTMLTHYDQSVDKLLPEWDFYNNETWCMIGYHAVSVISDAYLKGLNNFNYERAYDAIKTTALNPDYDHVKTYSKIGYVPCDLENESVSKTLEYAYDDYCVAQMAKKLGKNDDYKIFMKRAMSYKKLFDPETKFMRGKDSKGKWRTPFDPKSYQSSGDFTEATSWQYTWYVPQDVQGLINLMGGDSVFIAKLDELFSSSSYDNEEGTEDIHGIIGQYWHGNEPSHHIAYLYDYAGQPWKTQKLIHRIMKTQYGNKPNSLCGNDDCGQMSAWYVFNIMGFYPVCPVNDEYVIGSPCAKEAEMHLSNGKCVTMFAENYSDTNIYIQSMTLNGKDWNKTFIPYDEIKNGAEIKYVMGSEPNKKWATELNSVPNSISTLKNF